MPGHPEALSQSSRKDVRGRGFRSDYLSCYVKGSNFGYDEQLEAVWFLELPPQTHASLCLELRGSLLFYPLGNEGIMSKIYN